jgi:hypothetical protein
MPSVPISSIHSTLASIPIRGVRNFDFEFRISRNFEVFEFRISSFVFRVFARNFVYFAPLKVGFWGKNIRLGSSEKFVT